MLRLLGKPNDRDTTEVLFVTGVHREERDFGNAVADRLDHTRFAPLRIPAGLSGKRPGPEGIDDYRRRHRDLYRQILDHVRPHQHVLIDLHTGIDERHRSADVLCAHTGVLERVQRGAPQSDGQRSIRCVRLVADAPRPPVPAVPAAGPTQATPAASPAWPALRPEIPEAVWRGDDPLYIGIEIYLPQPGPGTTADADFAAGVTVLAADCALACLRAPRTAGKRR